LPSELGVREGEARVTFTPSEVTADHARSSAALIESAARRAGSGGAAVLGCGDCTELAVEDLAASFERLDLVDVNDAALGVVSDRIEADDVLRRVVRIHHADLTGLVARLAPAVRSIIANARDPLACLEDLGTLLTATAPSFWTPPEPGRYTLVVCAGVLTQLQATARQVVEAMYVGAFPEFAFALTTHQAWRRSAWRFARTLEAQFIEYLDTLGRPGTIVYLADTVHACWLVECGPETFRTEGAWVATQSARLRDYLPPWHEVLVEDAWPWIVRRRQGQYWGRLYGQQALIYRVGSPA